MHKQTSTAGRPPATDGDEKLVPLHPFTFEKAEQLENFAMSEKREDKISPSLSRTTQHVCNFLSRRKDQPFNRVFAWLTSRGLIRLNALPDVREIKRVLGILTDRGAYIGALDTW